LPGQIQEIQDGIDNNCNDQVDETGSQRPNGDTDGDSLPDDWEMQYFRTLLYGPTDDPDGDGISNILEKDEGTNPNVPDKKEGSLLWLWIIIGIIIFIAIIFLAFKFLAKPKSGGGITSSYIDPRMKAYIQDSLAKGFTKNQIKQALLSKGWSERDIDKVLK
jgi:hypothetical protein